MQKIKKVLLSLFGCIVLLPTSIFAANVTYKDFMDDRTLANDYSYGTLVWNENTQIINMTEDQEKVIISETSDVWSAGATQEGIIKFKITNCAVDKDGDMCDAFILVDNVTRFTKNVTGRQSRMGTNWFGLTTSDTYIDIGIQVCKGIDVSTDFSNTSSHIDCNLLRFNFCTEYAYADFHMTYYKAGTETLANIPNVSSFIYDVDVANVSTNYLTEPLKGNEGVIPLLDSTIYYNTLDQDSKFNYLTNEFGGICTPNQYYYGYDGAAFGTTGISKATSAMIVQKTNAQFEITYTGTGCGIFYVFVSAIPYELGNPIKKVSKANVLEDELFYYNISQYIPNNYYTSLIDLEGTNENLYLKLVISDSLDENLELQENITIKNSKGQDCLSYFEISKENHQLVATVKSDALALKNFYNETYTISLPVKIKKGTTNLKISNKAKVESELRNVTTTLESNIVNVEIEHKVTLKVTVENGTQDEEKQVFVKKGNSNTFEVIIKPNENYVLKTVTLNGQTVDIKDLTKENDGSYKLTIKDENINKDIDHVVIAKCELKDVKVITKYVDEEGTIISETVEQTKKMNDEYTTQSKEIQGYELKEVPINYKGIADKDETIVVYEYKVKPIIEPEDDEDDEENKEEKKEEEEISDIILPNTGKKNGIEYAIMISAVITLISWGKYKKYKNMK